MNVRTETRNAVMGLLETLGVLLGLLLILFALHYPYEINKPTDPKPNFHHNPNEETPSDVA